MSLEKKIAALHASVQNIGRDYAPAALASSFSVEDMVLTDVIAKHVPEVGIFTLDTGRLPEATYVLMQKVRERYGDVVQIFAPDCASLAEFVAAYGPNGFYDSVEVRKQCCQVRKLAPLKRALNDKSAWLTGLRREQAVTRASMQRMEWDDLHHMPKFNPLVDWTEQDVWDYIKQFDVPYNTLHDEGYPSIGCAPCTRAINEGEDIRAGRWWWENPETKECGLHVKA